MDKKVYEFISQQVNDPIIERRICRRTGQEFPIYQGDIDLLDKISPVIADKKFSLPLPTLSPLARMRRRMMFRNERALYRNSSAISHKNLISLHHPDTGISVATSKEREEMDPKQFARDYIPSDAFLTQFQKLHRAIPKMAMVELYNENSDYDNYSGYNKNTYLNADIIYSEDVSYSTTIKKVTRGYDLLQVHDSELVYQCVASAHLTKCSYVWYSDNCYTCSFLMTCSNCSNCYFCSNISNKQNHIFNAPASEEEIKHIQEKMKSYTGLQELLQQFDTFLLSQPRPATWVVNSEHSVGSSLTNTKDLFFCYDTYDAEECRYCMVSESNTTCMDTTIFNPNAFKVYEAICGGILTNSVCAYTCFESSYTYFCDTCMSCSYMIGCSGMKHAQYCIFNKQYSKEEREKLAVQILGQTHQEKVRGEFFPTSLTTYPYNDTVAIDYFPVCKVINHAGTSIIVDKSGTGTVYLLEDKFIAKAELDLGGERIPITRRTQNYDINIPKDREIIQAKDLPDSIDDVSDDILQQIIICQESKRPYTITPLELSFYRKMGVALPRIHYSLRHTQRIKSRPTKEFYLRTCDKTGEQILSLYPADAAFPVYSQPAFEKLIYG